MKYTIFLRNIKTQINDKLDISKSKKFVPYHCKVFFHIFSEKYFSNPSFSSIFILFRTLQFLKNSIKGLCVPKRKKGMAKRKIIMLDSRELNFFNISSPNTIFWISKKSHYKLKISVKGSKGWSSLCSWIHIKYGKCA